MAIVIKAKYKSFNGKVYSSRYLRGATIVIGIPCSTLDPFVLNNIKKRICEEDKGVLYKYTELTALFYALFGEIKNKLMTPTQTKSSSLHDVYCYYYNNYFNLVFVTTNGTGTAVKKILTEAFKILNPAKLWKSYDLILRGLGLKISKEEFKWCVDQINECLKKELLILIIGKINYGKTASEQISKFEHTLKTSHDKFKAGNNMNKQNGDKPGSLKNLGYSLPLTDHAINVSGISAYYLQKYISYLTKNSINTDILGSKLIVHTHKYDWLVNEMKKSKTLDNYIKLKYKKKSVEPALTGLILIDAAACGVDAKSLFSISNIKHSDIKSTIKKYLPKN